MCKYHENFILKVPVKQILLTLDRATIALSPWFQSLCWGKLTDCYIYCIDLRVVSIFSSNPWQESD